MNKLRTSIARVPRRPAFWTILLASWWALATADWLWFQAIRGLLEIVGNWAFHVPWLGWLVPVADWLADSNLFHWMIFVPSTVVAANWAWWATRPGLDRPVLRAGILTGVYVVGWQFVVFLTLEIGWSVVNTQLARLGTGALFAIGLCWVIWAVEEASQHYERTRPPGEEPDLGGELRMLLVLALVFPPVILLWARRRRYPLRRVALGLLPPALAYFLLIPVWIDLLTGLSKWAITLESGESVYLLGEYLDFLAALWWLIFPSLLLVTGLTARAWTWGRQRRLDADALLEDASLDHQAWWRNDLEDIDYTWNPLDQNAWYYGQHSRKLNQSLGALVGYSMSFMITFLLLGQIGGCSEIYEMPEGGGEQAQIAQTVRIQKVIKLKYVVNPFSAILFQVPPIDDIKLQLTELTHHAYKVGYGEGKGAGYAGGTSRGKVRFIRLEYSGGDWNQDFGVGADLNMLIEYNVRTQQRVHDKTESRTIAQLRNFPIGKSPPMVYMTGQQNISLSTNEIKVLREYLIDKHGMIFGDNGGSSHFHNQFVSMMRRVLPKIDPVAVPLDDKIHRIPYQIPFLPYVAPHGGLVALGWKVDGRWVCYYHPGDIGDAWADGHAGVKPEIYEYCYQLGTNVINYAHAEYSKWLEARSERSERKRR